MLKSPIKRIKWNVMVGRAVLFAVVFVSAELIARAYYLLTVKNTPSMASALRLPHMPLAYRNSPYYTPERKELNNPDLQFQSGYFTNADGGKFDRNYKNGACVTTGQPTQYARTIWLLGNSALEGQELPDELTIASQLQRDVPDRVVNLGVRAANIGHMRYQLKALPVQEGDVVIAFLGGNEAIHVWETATPLLRTPLCRTVSLELYMWKAHCRDTTAPIASQFIQDANSEILENWRQAIGEMRTIAKGRGVSLIIISQPHAYYRMTDYHAFLMQFQPYDMAFEVVYKAFTGVVDYDWAGLVQPTEFFNAVHVNEAGAGVIASYLRGIVEKIPAGQKGK